MGMGVFQPQNYGQKFYGHHAFSERSRIPKENGNKILGGEVRSKSWLSLSFLVPMELRMGGGIV